MKHATAPFVLACALSLTLLTGCAPSSGPQSLELSYFRADDFESITTVEFGNVTCDRSDGSASIESAEVQGSRSEPTFTATNIGERITRVSLQFDNIYVFTSSEPFTITDGSVTFSDLSGMVSRNSGSERVIDAEATLSGTVAC